MTNDLKACPVCGRTPKVIDCGLNYANLPVW